MCSKYMFCLLVIAIKSRLLYGQCEKKYFRNDYIYKEDTKNFYKINTSFKTWSEAKINCVLDRATLFYPEDEKEAKSIIEFWNERQPPLRKLWIGVADWIIEQSYETVDGKSISEVYDKWAFNEPDSSSGDKGCVVMQGDSTLRAENCSNSYSYFCKKTPASFEWNTECSLPDIEYKYNKDLQRCYKFHLTPERWGAAYSICKMEQSHLAIIDSQTEYNYLKNITAEADKYRTPSGVRRDAVYLGFYNNKGVWETIYGEPFQDSGFGNVGNYTPPDNDQETCGSMLYSGELTDKHCNIWQFFICEHAIDPRDVEGYNKTQLSCI